MTLTDESGVSGSTNAFSDEKRRPPKPSRSSSGLAAEAASAALRDFARGRPSSKRSSTASSISNASFHSTQNRPNSRGENPFNRPSSRRHASTPSISPPFTSSSSSSHAESPDTSENSTAKPQQNPDPAVNPKARIPPNIPQALPIPPPRPRGRPNVRPIGSNTPNTSIPRTLSDLGRDYSRYPPPSGRNSFSLPSTPAPRYSGGSTPLLSPNTKEDSGGIAQIGYIFDPEKKAAFLDDRLAATSFAGEAGNAFPLYMDEKEADDDLHNPQPGDERNPKPQLRDCLSPRQLSSIFGLLCLLLGLLCVFILLPVLSYTGHAIYSYPHYAPSYNESYQPAEPWAHVNDIKYPLFQNLRTGLIDPRTPATAKTRQAFDGTSLSLVFSDEFSTPNRTFYPGDDPYWTAPDIWYGATQDMEWYDPDAATTANGTLQLRLDKFFNHDLLYRSGMLNSWNQLCMKGGALEVSVSLPGPGGASGLWPGIWTMGNLGRPGYSASTEGLWPYTYNSCDVGITPNQSMSDGTSYLPGQKLPSCTCAGEDHPTPGTGRGAPEIDVFEASADATLKLGLITQSYQVAPFDIWYHPNYDFLSIPNINVTQMNAYCGGPFQQAVSAQTELNNKWYDGEEYQKYGFEYTPGTLSNAQITWFVGDEISFSMSGNAVGPNGNADTRPVSEEPMSIVLNVGFSTAWTGIQMDQLRFPTTMYVDYVRIYQLEGQESITCDPPGYETTDYIKKHPDAYHNSNLTLWSETRYPWPKNKMNSDCT